MKGGLTLVRSTIRDLQVDGASLNATLSNATLNVAKLDVHGPALDGQGKGTVTFHDETATDFEYDVTRADLAQLRSVIGPGVAGTLATKGRMTDLQQLFARPARPPNRLDGFLGECAGADRWLRRDCPGGHIARNGPRQRHSF